MCKDGACVRDPALERVRCQGSGATCGYCQGGVCTPSDQRPCDDGVCPRKGQCCSGEKWCEDPESSTGFACVGETDCCPGQKKCRNGSCVTPRSCCPEAPVPPCSACGTVFCSNGQYVCEQKCCANEKPCADGTCVNKTDCCHGEKPCGNGVCVDSLSCCPNQKTCDAGICVDKDMCCPFYKKCPDGSCVKETECCGGQQRCGGMCCLAGKSVATTSAEVTADVRGFRCGGGTCITTQVSTVLWREGLLGPTPTAAGTAAARIRTSVAAPPAALAQGEGDCAAPTVIVRAAVTTAAVVAVVGAWPGRISRRRHAS